MNETSTVSKIKVPTDDPAGLGLVELNELIAPLFGWEHLFDHEQEDPESAPVWSDNDGNTWSHGEAVPAYPTDDFHCPEMIRWLKARFINVRIYHMANFEWQGPGDVEVWADPRQHKYCDARSTTKSEAESLCRVIAELIWRYPELATPIEPKDGGGTDVKA